jgi:hypothetical protein
MIKMGLFCSLAGSQERQGGRGYQWTQETRTLTSDIDEMRNNTGK